MKQKPALSAAALPFAVNRLYVDRILLDVLLQ